MKNRFNCFVFTILFLTVLLVCGLFNLSKGDNTKISRRQQYAMYVEQINELVKDIDFRKGYLEEGVIALYDAFERKIGEIAFESYNGDYPLDYFRKDGDNIFYIEYGAVDDEFGIMFINGDENSVLNGVANLERCGGNSYYYDTMMKE